MADDPLETSIVALDDKNAVKVASALVGQAFSTVGDVAPEELAHSVTSALAATGEAIQPSAGDQWLKIDLPANEAGPVARSLLLAAARNPGLASIIRSEINEPARTLDLGHMAAIVPVALMYLLMATEVRYEGTKVTVIKHGYSAKELTALVKQMPRSVINSIAGLFDLGVPPSRS